MRTSISADLVGSLNTAHPKILMLLKRDLITNDIKLWNYTQARKMSGLWWTAVLDHEKKYRQVLKKTTPNLLLGTS